MVSGLDEIDEQLKAERQAYKTSVTDLSATEVNGRVKSQNMALESRVERHPLNQSKWVINRIIILLQMPCQHR